MPMAVHNLRHPVETTPRALQGTNCVCRTTDCHVAISLSLSLFREVGTRGSVGLPHFTVKNGISACQSQKYMFDT